MGYAVLHLDKTSGNETKMTAHIERTQMPKNADPERTHLNRELIELPEGVANRTEAIQHRLDTAGLTRKIGTNQVRAIRIMLTGSNEDMKRVEAEGRLEEWCNDNLSWLRKTYGTDNLVSAVLHLDEATPHIHATVVPIVTGERRKVKEKQKGEEPGKKKYRKKNSNAPRLCADDVMTRVKLKEYQDSYAGAMAKYGLERGIVGSEARHITTQEFYRNVIAKQQNLQEDIEQLLLLEEAKRKDIEELNQKEQEALTDYRQASSLKHQKETELHHTQTELKEVKSQLKTEKFKSSASELGTTLIDGIGSVIGTPKTRRQQQEIDNLKAENRNLYQKIKDLNDNLTERQKEYEKHTGDLTTRLNRVYKWFPDTEQLMKMGEYCRKIGFSDIQARDLVNMKPVIYTGELYSHEFTRNFKVHSSEIRLERNPGQSGSFNLTIDKTDMIRWFRQKYRELYQKSGMNIRNRQNAETGRTKGFRL